MSHDPLQPSYPGAPGGRPVKKGPDTAALGLLVGLLFPLIGIVLLYFFWPGRAGFSNYLKMFTTFSSSLAMTNASKVISLAMITNLLPFYYFLNRKRYLMVRGILISMVLIGLLIVLYRFVWQ